MRGGRRRQTVEPKPFVWIKLPEKIERVTPEFHHTFKGYTGRFELTMEVVSEYLHVGSGLIELDESYSPPKAYYSFARCNDQMVIPGTSVKGAIRSIVEAISASCVSQYRGIERLPRRYQPCEKVKPRQEKAAQLCPACRLFGTTGYRGRAYFSDAILQGKVKSEIVKIAELWSPRRIRVARKFYEVKTFQKLDDRPQRGYRFVEAVPKGTKFSLTLTFENASSSEMGLLMRALGWELLRGGEIKVDAFTPKLGGAKPRCFGAVCFRPQKLFLISSPGLGVSSILKHLKVGGEEMEWKELVVKWLGDRSLVVMNRLDELKTKLQPQEEPCPEGVY